MVFLIIYQYNLHGITRIKMIDIAEKMTEVFSRTSFFYNLGILVPYMILRL
jgi:hypothetical protein